MQRLGFVSQCTDREETSGEQSWPPATSVAEHSRTAQPTERLHHRDALRRPQLSLRYSSASTLCTVTSATTGGTTLSPSRIRCIRSISWRSLTNWLVSVVS